MFNRESLVAALAVALRAPIRNRPLIAAISARLTARDVVANYEILARAPKLLPKAALDE
jgi:hypothetical protein